MPVNPTYPGVYIEEVPSGVRTITGVSTSVTAFVGQAKRGPIERPMRLLSFADFERRFGGLDPDSEMSYGVRQFFLNGGSEAWVVRLAKNPIAALKTLKNADAADVLKLTARDKGAGGNFIEVRVDYATARPTSTFNLTLNYSDPDNPADTRSETFANLSMNSADPRYAVDVLKGSELVSAERVAALGGLGAGTSVSAPLVDGSGTPLVIASLLDDTHNAFQVAVNGLAPVKVTLALPGDITGVDPLAKLCDSIQTKVRAQAAGRPALLTFACVKDGNTIKMTSGQAGELSSVRALPAPLNDASVRLKLGAVETDAVGVIRPKEMPDPGTLTSGAFVAADATTFPDATHTTLLLSLDGARPVEIVVGAAPFAGANLADRLGKIAAAIQTAVRAARSTAAFSGFTCTGSGGTKLVFTSGTRGAGSSVLVTAPAVASLANEFHLLAGSVIVDGANVYLEGGSESKFGDADAFSVFVGSRAKREGLYALENVALFNLLCLPGLSDAGVLAEAAAYCESRRAFLIADVSTDVDTPEEMVTEIGGSDLPKSRNAAVYFPWIKIPDPLRGGALRLSAPSGTVAGLYARTDSQRGVWKAPAGQDASLVGVQGLAYTLTDGENGVLNPLGVNCLRAFPASGLVAWGARTLRGADALADEYKYIPVRRIALYLEESLYQGTQWVVFEPNDEPLWSQIRLNLGAFMNTLFRQGAFAGRTPAEAYFVKCDKETTTQDDINRGVVNILVGFAPLKPAEFVIVKIQQMAGQIQA